jgi:hypothetical protein
LKSGNPEIALCFHGSMPQYRARRRKSPARIPVGVIAEFFTCRLERGREGGRAWGVGF